MSCRSASCSVLHTTSSSLSSCFFLLRAELLPAAAAAALLLADGDFTAVLLPFLVDAFAAFAGDATALPDGAAASDLHSHTGLQQLKP